MLHMFGHESQRGWNAAGTRLLLLRRCGGLRPSILHRHVVRRPEDCTDAADICKAMGNLPRLLLTVPKSTVARYFIHIYFVCGGSLRPSRKYNDGYNESNDCTIKYKISAYMANLDYVGMECNMPSRSWCRWFIKQRKTKTWTCGCTCPQPVSNTNILKRYM